MRKLLFWFHLVVGVVFGVLILVKAVTGAILVLEHPLVDLMERDRRIVVVPSENVSRLPLSTLVSKAQLTHPKQKPSSVAVNAEATSSVVVGFGREGAVYMNPYTGEALGGNSKTHDFFHEVEDLHRWFGFRSWGRPLSGAVTIAFFVLALSGVYLWWPSTWSKSKVRSVTVFNSNLSGKARDWNWHNVIGFWSSPFLVIITVTGIVMAYSWANNALYRITGNEPPPPQREASAGMAGKADPNSGADSPMVSIDTLFDRAQQLVPVWSSISFRFPQKPHAPVTAQILEWDYVAGIPQRSQATFNATTAELLKWEPFSGANSGRKARMWARYLHTGEAGGPAGQFVALLASVGTCFLVWTGFALAWRRYRSWRKNKI